MSWLTKILGIDAKREAAQMQNDTARTAAENARADAKLQADATLAQQKQYQDTLTNIQTNAQKLTDANNANAGTGPVTNVIAAASASAFDQLRKKKQGTSLSSSLGINI